MTKSSVCAVFAALLSSALPALAQETPAKEEKPEKRGRVITISEVTIVGRVQKPVAAVDVSRIQPKLTLAELNRPFLQRIEKAISRDPF